MKIKCIISNNFKIVATSTDKNITQLPSALTENEGPNLLGLQFEKRVRPRIMGYLRWKVSTVQLIFSESGGCRVRFVVPFFVVAKIEIATRKRDATVIKPSQFVSPRKDQLKI